MTKDELIAMAGAAAVRHTLLPALVCAVIEQESGWNVWAVRYEPAFRVRYVAPLHLPPTQEICESMSWGLMQLMGLCAREDGYPGPIPALLDPATALEWGCVHFARKMAQARGNIHDALQLWNGGANLRYADQVLARMQNYIVPTPTAATDPK